MRIAMSAYKFSTDGGIERASWEVAKRVAQGDNDVTLVGTSVPDLAHSGLRWIKVPPHRGPHWTIPTSFPRAATRSLSGRTFDVLHDQGGCALRSHDVVTAHSCHRAWWDMKLQSGEKARAYLNPLHSAVLRSESRSYRPGAYRYIIAVSKGVAKEINQIYGAPTTRIAVIPNGVDVPRFQRSLEQRVRLRTSLRLHEEDVVMVFVGKEFRRKGLAYAIESLSLLPETAKLIVVGGDTTAPYEKLATTLGVRSRVVFVGHRQDVERYFSAADVFVFPSAYEAFALVTLEAAAAGLPLVTTKVNGTEEFVKEGINGSFTERDASSLARTLLPLMDKPELRSAWGENALDAVRAYTWERAARLTEDVYAETLAEKRFIAG